MGLQAGDLYPDFGLLWSPISPLGLQGGLSGAACSQSRTASLPPDRKGLSRLWVTLFGMVFPLNFVLCRGTFPVLFINSSRLSCLAEPGLGAPLSSYLEGALYKLIDR